jgi:hypothetical protein
MATDLRRPTHTAINRPDEISELDAIFAAPHSGGIVSECQSYRCSFSCQLPNTNSDLATTTSRLVVVPELPFTPGCHFAVLGCHFPKLSLTS